MKTFFSRKIILVAIGGLILGAGTALILKGRSAVQAEFVSVKRMDIVENVLVTGRVKARDSVDLGFEKGGTVDQIFVNVGDPVYSGERLISLNSSDAQADLLQAEATLEAEEASLGAITRGSRPEQIDLEKVKVANATTALSDARTALTLQLMSALTTVDDSIHNKTDQFFSNPRSDTPQLNFNVSDSQLKNDIENGRRVVEKIITTWNGTLSDLALGKITVEDSLSLANKNLLMVKNFLDNIGMEVNALTVSSNIPQTTIDAWKAAVSTARSNVNSAVSAVSQASGNFQSAKSALSLETSQLLLMQAGSDPQDIKAQNAKVLSAQANIEKLRATLSKLQLVSPIDGVVTKQDAKIGQTVSTNLSIVSIIGNGDYEVASDVPETDIGRIRVGSPVSITLDAYPGVLFEASVVKIDPAETVIDGVVSYKVTVDFRKKDSRIKSGLTANLEIESRKKVGVLSIPQVVVIETDRGTTVKRKQGSVVAEVPVTLGIRDRDGNVEVLSGLSLNDEVQVIGLK